MKTEPDRLSGGMTAEALQRFDCSSWETLSTADAPEKLAKIARDAAISRVPPIADGPNQWFMHRSSADTGGSGVAMVGTESSPLSGPPVIGADQGGPPTHT
jgi:hypothetical protein